MTSGGGKRAEVHAGLFAAFFLSVATGCPAEPPPPPGNGSGVVCPETQTLTYDNFGKEFFVIYCQPCHASQVTGASRQEAPTSITYDTLEQIRSRLDVIDSIAVSGPNRITTEMPPKEALQPTANDRMKLGEWVACGAP
jgi:uncharacterized membrane protein